MIADQKTVTDPRRTDIADLLAVTGERSQTMPGFDDEFIDIVDYIIRITHRIWEQRRLDLIDRYYAEDCVIRTLMGPVAGREGVIRNTLHTLGVYPDRCLIGDAVIWSDNGNAVYYSSHRIVSHMSATGPMADRAQAGSRATVLTIADCVCRENRIVEEWLVRDTAALHRQFGQDPVQRARASRPSDEARTYWAEIATHVADNAAVSAAPPSLSDVETVFAALNRRDFGFVRSLYWPNAERFAPPAALARGHEGIAQALIGFIAPFADGRFAVDHISVTPWQDRTEIAARWTFAGHQSGPFYGITPVGLPVSILGVTHFTIIDGRIIEEYTVYDLIAVLAQLIAREAGHEP